MPPDQAKFCNGLSQNVWQVQQGVSKGSRISFEVCWRCQNWDKRWVLQGPTPHWQVADTWLVLILANKKTDLTSSFSHSRQEPLPCTPRKQFPGPDSRHLTTWGLCHGPLPRPVGTALVLVGSCTASTAGYGCGRAEDGCGPGGFPRRLRPS